MGKTDFRRKIIVGLKTNCKNLRKTSTQALRLKYFILQGGTGPVDPRFAFLNNFNSPATSKIEVNKFFDHFYQKKNNQN